MAIQENSVRNCKKHKQEITHGEGPPCVKSHQDLEGIRATIRSEVVNSSICSQGRIHATAL